MGKSYSREQMAWRPGFGSGTPGPQIMLPLESTHSAIIESNPTEPSLHAYVTGSPTKLTCSIRAVNLFNSF